MSNESLQKGIESFLDHIKNEQSNIVFQQTLFVCRNDGLVLYFHSRNDSVNKNSVGALVGGLWQAGQTVVDLFGKQKSSEGFRLSFDKSDTGIHLLPFQAEQTEYFMGMFFDKTINPGLIKNKMKNLLEGLKEHISNKNFEEPVQEMGNNPFNNITDDEINDLFSFAEN